MRSTSVLWHPAVVLSSLFALASASNSGRVECIHTSSRQLAAFASCGDEGSLSYCFSNTVSRSLATPIEQLAAELESCFHNAGCTVPESQIEAVWALRRCGPEGSDLRRRRGVNGAAIVARQDDETTSVRQTNTRQTAAQTTPQTSVRQTPLTTPTNTRQQTTAQSSAPQTLTPETNTPTNTPTRPLVTTDSPTLTTTAGNLNSPSVCFTETLIDITSCPVQSTGPSSGKRLPCFQTTVPSQVCAAGLICQMDPQGNPNCMFKQSQLTTPGIIIAIFFATAIAASIIGICFFCCRERREHRRLIRAAEAAKIAQEAKTQALVNAKKPVSVSRGGVGGDTMDRQPLMSNAPDLAAAPQQYGGGYQGVPGTEYGGAHGSNPFADSHDTHPLR